MYDVFPTAPLRFGEFPWAAWRRFANSRLGCICKLGWVSAEQLCLLIYGHFPVRDGAWLDVARHSSFLTLMLSLLQLEEETNRR